MLGKRGEGLTINKLILIILAILVLLALLMFIFKVDILEWLRNLPDYTYEEDKEIDYTKLSPDKLALLNCVRIAEIGDRDVRTVGQDVRELFIIFSGKRKIGLHVDVDNSNNYYIKVVEEANIDVGEVKDKKLTIKKEILENYDSNTRLKNYVSLEDLKMLNGARLLGALLLCKTKEEMEKEAVKKIILGKEVFLTLDDGEERCKITKVSDDNYKWLENYGLKDGKLEYFENGVWKKVDNEIPDDGQIALREKKDELINKKNKLKINYKNEDYGLLLDSEKGLYFEISEADKYLLTKTGVVKYTYEEKYVDLASDIEKNLIEAFKDALLKQSLDLDFSNSEYFLYENLFSPFYNTDIYYGVDDVNNFYKSISSGTGKTWQKFEGPDHGYLYVNSDYWEHMKERSKIKDELTKECQK